MQQNPGMQVYFLEWEKKKEATQLSNKNLINWAHMLERPR